MARRNSGKTRRSIASSKGPPALADRPMKDIYDTASTVEKLIRTVGTMTAEQRARLSVILTYSLLGAEKSAGAVKTLTIEQETSHGDA